MNKGVSGMSSEQTKNPTELLFDEMSKKINDSANEREANLSKIRKILFKTELSKTAKLPEVDELIILFKNMYDTLKRTSDAMTPVQLDLLNSSIFIASTTNKIEIILDKLAQKVFQMDVQLATIAEFLVEKGLATETGLQEVCDRVIAPKIEEMRKEEQQKPEEKKEESRIWTPDSSLKV